MKARTFLRMIRRSVGNFAAISRGRFLKRTYVPEPRSAISIETSQRCNLACRFCAYPKRGPGKFMTLATFQEAVQQALHYGSHEFWLTPMLGEIFADQKWSEKFRYLENELGVQKFGFFTNFILPSPGQILHLCDYKKLSSLHISIYGHDLNSFVAITRRPKAQYDRLINNLEALGDIISSNKFSCDIHFSMRTLGGISAATIPNTPLVVLLKKLKDMGNVTFIVSTDFDNWGGTVTEEDTKEIATGLIDGRGIYMFGACHLLFSTPQISANGDVRACACRDVDGSLTIGNIYSEPLREIHSWSNPVFRRIVDEQQSGQYGKNCRSCSMYRSVYDHRPAHNTPRWPIVSLVEAKKVLQQK
ncbi:MAG: hypothetical protein CMF69_03265 [Magnetovibrio sp.]|nr:hypothetical protein [Magnetovibrio sp.]